MALPVRLRQSLFRSSSIHKYCSFSPIAPDSSHLINLSKIPFPAASRLENSSICPTPSKHDRSPPSASLKNRFLFGPYYRFLPETKRTEDETDFPKFPKPSPEETIETCFQTLAKLLGSVDDAKVIEEMTDKLKKFGLEMIKQLKGDKCWNDVITRRLPSPPTECENQLSVEDMEMIDEMSEKLTKYVKILEKLKAMHGYTSHSHDLCIHRKNKKPKDCIEKAKAPPHVPRERSLSEAFYIDQLMRFKDYIEMTKTTRVPKKSQHYTFSPEEISFFASRVENLKSLYGRSWRRHAFGANNFKKTTGYPVSLSFVEHYHTHPGEC